MSSGASEPDHDAAFASLSGPALVAYLRSTCRRADYDAAARVLDVRDRRLARAEAQLAESKAALAELQRGVADANARLDALRKEYLALRAARRGPIGSGHPSPGAIAGPSPAPRADGRAEGAGKEGAGVVNLHDRSEDGGGDKDREEREFRPDVAGVSCKAKESAPEGGQRRRAGVSCQAKESAPVGGEKRRSTVSRKRKPTLYVPFSSSSEFDEEDRIPLSQLVKKLWGAKHVPNGKPKKGHGDAQAKNSVGPLGDHPPEKPPVNRVGVKASAAGQRAGASHQLKAATFLQRKRRISQPGEGGGLSRAMPSPPPTDSAVGNKPGKNSSMIDGAEDGGPSRAMPTPLPMGSAVGNKPQKHSSMVDCAGEGGPSRVIPTPPPTDSVVGNKPRKNSTMVNCAEEGGQPRVMPTPPATDSAVGNKPLKNSSIVDYAEEGGPSRVVPTPPPTDSAVGNKPRKISSMVDGAEDGGPSRAMLTPLPMGSAVGNEPQKNSSMADGIGAEDGGPSRAMPTPPPTISTVGYKPRKNSSKSDGAEDRGQSRAMAIPLPTGSAVGNCHKKNSKPDGAEDGGPSKAMLTPLSTGFAVGNCPLKNSSKADGAEAGACIGGKQGPAAGPQGYTPFQLRTPSHAVTARKIVELARGGVEKPKNHTGSEPNASMSLVLGTSREQRGIDGILPVASALPLVVTNQWKSASDVYTSCLLNTEVCMQATCALHRQSKLIVQGGRRGHTLSKYDVHRASLLAEFLLDGNPQGPLIRTAEELAKLDSRGLDLLVRVATEFSEQLFGIYRNKEDPYFC